MLKIKNIRPIARGCGCGTKGHTYILTNGTHTYRFTCTGIPSRGYAKISWAALAAAC